MPRKPSYARVSITLPREVLAAADRHARELDRPRSWVIAEAVRSYQSGVQRQTVAPPGAAEVAAA
ncbi:MAG: ribbon-helix-helix domain-containing protein, partial [Gemmatimonadales bacterium]